MRYVYQLAESEAFGRVTQHVASVADAVYIVGIQSTRGMSLKARSSATSNICARVCSIPDGMSGSYVGFTEPGVRFALSDCDGYVRLFAYRIAVIAKTRRSARSRLRSLRHRSLLPVGTRLQFSVICCK